MIKVSILLLYRRLFNFLWLRSVTLIIGIVCTSWFVAALLCLAFQCQTEAERNNASSLYSDQCTDRKAYWTAIASSNMGLDVVILCLPLYMARNLQLATRQKKALSGIFALGAL